MNPIKKGPPTTGAFRWKSGPVIKDVGNFLKVKLGFLIPAMVLCSCEFESEMYKEPEMTHPVIADARKYFESQIVQILPDDDSGTLLYTGTFVPDWSTAGVAETDEVYGIDVSLQYPRFRYKIGQWALKNDTVVTREVIATQKMVLIRNKKTSRYTGYFVTLIPSKKYYETHKSTDADAFSVYGDKGDFTGRVIFTTPDKGEIVRINACREGQITAGATLICPPEEREQNLVRLKQLFHGITITRYAQASTRGYWEGGSYWLDEVVVTPDNNNNNGNDYWWYWCSGNNDDWNDDDWWNDTDLPSDDYGGGGGGYYYDDDYYYDYGGSSSGNGTYTSLPSYSSLSSKYSVIAKLSAKEVYEKIGGKVLYNYNNTPGYKNTCAIRLSYALNQMDGHKIPYTSGQTSSGDDGSWYFFRVDDMVQYLNNKYGKCVKTSMSALSGQPGIIWQTDCNWDDAAGHLDVWNGTSAIYQYYSACKDVYVWKH